MDKDVDFDRIGLLLNILHLCATGGPAYGNIVRAATEELKQINADLASVPPPAEPAPPVQEEVKAPAGRRL